ncbi:MULTISPECIES: alpha/beta hydrolase [unclassified Polaromonas]|uniref:alpha/beta hydrolase n=1 Tax=unclassified Polaromonas TaxID=2638319 RepID=UPI0018CA24C9|nr:MULTISPECIES: alpha/beta hydrolase [unclassified Polaromonas]MBG6071758.1 arylformamidase [Polaromonas sp. CG_9.7]MBG6113759.1 arylformamidase [Polaromonas sp. CG_9.2]MDH6184341.1 arylformamidase [Polaromonas sp. CG_23.6]
MKSQEQTWNPLWLDSMYNNRLLVPGYATHFTRWVTDSQHARQKQPCLLDVAYGEQPGETLDIFPASGVSPAKGAPVLVFIHGGYWRALDKADHSFIAPTFTQAGACVVVLNYTLCPAVTIPEIVSQMVKALAWTWRHIEAQGGDPARITVAGHSAGGHLAAMLLTCAWPAHATDLPKTLVKSALSISGLFDLEPIRQTPFLQDLNLTPEQVRQASPVLLPRPRQGTLCSVAGGDESEEFLRQNLLIQQTWGMDTVPVCESLPGLNHFSVLEAMIAPGHRLHQLTLELLGLDEMPRH